MTAPGRETTRTFLSRSVIYLAGPEQPAAMCKCSVMKGAFTMHNCHLYAREFLYYASSSYCVHPMHTAGF